MTTTMTVANSRGRPPTPVHAELVEMTSAIVRPEKRQVGSSILPLTTSFAV